MITSVWNKRTKVPYFPIMEIISLRNYKQDKQEEK